MLLLWADGIFCLDDREDSGTASPTDLPDRASETATGVVSRFALTAEPPAAFNFKLNDSQSNTNEHSYVVISLTLRLQSEGFVIVLLSFVDWRAEAPPPKLTFVYLSHHEEASPSLPHTCTALQ